LTPNAGLGLRGIKPSSCKALNEIGPLYSAHHRVYCPLGLAVPDQIRAVDKSREGDRLLGSVPDKMMESVERAILLTLGMEGYARSLE